MNEPTTISPDLLKLEPETVLVRKDGDAKIAVVKSSAFDKKDKRKWLGYNVEFTEGSKVTIGLLHQNHLDKWMLKPVADASIVAEMPTEAQADDDHDPTIDLPTLWKMYDDLHAEYTSFNTAALEEKISRLEDQRDSAIDDASEANAEVSRLEAELNDADILAMRNGELQIRNAELLDRAQKAENQKSDLEAQLHAAMERLTAAAQRSADLPDQRDWALEVSEGAGGMVKPSSMTPPVREFKIVRNITEADMCRMEKDDWQVQHIQFSDDGNLNIVYSRYSQQPAPIQPQPTAAVKTVAPDSIINPADELIKSATPEAELHLDEADLIETHADLAADLTSLPRFNAQQYMAETLQAAVNEANAAVAARMPIYNEIRRKRLPNPNAPRPTARPQSQWGQP